MRRRTAPLFAMLLACAGTLFFAPLPAQVAQTHAHAVARLESLTGLYAPQDEPEQQVAVTLARGHLFLESERSPRVELTAEAGGRFAGADRLQIVFTHDALGKTTGLNESRMDARGSLRARSYTRLGDAVQLNHFRQYTRTEVMVPMRDGVRLHTVLFRPADTKEPLPILLERTPYGTEEMNSDVVNASKPEAAASGYLFVFQDIRGRFRSEGQFVMMRPLTHAAGDRDNAARVDESTDAYDTAEWLVHHVETNNGRVGVYGISYPGFLAMMAGIDHHPAVKAISPQAPMTDVWLYDDFFHNGAFRQTYGFDYAEMMERNKENEILSLPEDTYSYFLRYGSFADAAKAAHITSLPTAQRFLNEPTYTDFWKSMAVQPHLAAPEVPTLEVGGWWDQEDMAGPQAEYAAMRAQEDPNDPAHRVYLVLGPWSHGAWSYTSRHLGALDFGAATGDAYRKQIEFPFFEKYLKGRPGFDLTDTASFRTGSNHWHRYEQWPPQSGFHRASLYLAPRHGLSLNEPRRHDERGQASYLSDPADPTPYRPRPIQSTYGEGSTWSTWLVADQSFLAKRKDLVRFETLPLDSDTTVTGDVLADIFASTTGTDADWVVKLIDVYPEVAPQGMSNYELMIADEIFRGRYWDGFETAHAIEAGKVKEYRWSLHGVDHTFLKGHRVLVEVQSAWFPLYDRNPQTFVPNIMRAPAESYAAQTQTVYFSRQHPSHLEFMMPDLEGK